MTRMSLARLLSASLLLFAGAAQGAPTAAQQQAIRSACPTDYRTYCASVPPGGAEALQCLESNAANLSASCKEAVEAVSDADPAAPSSSAAPGADAPAASTGTAAPAKTTDPTGETTVVVIEPGQAIRLMRESCGPDYRAHCGDQRIIGGAALRCLVANGPSLQPACKSELSRLGQKF